MPHKDETLLLADVGRKALRQVEVLVTQLLERHSPPERAKVVAHLLAGGVWTFLGLRARLKKQQVPFSATVDEIKRDREWLSK